MLVIFILLGTGIFLMLFYIYPIVPYALALCALFLFTIQYTSFVVAGLIPPSQAPPVVNVTDSVSAVPGMVGGCAGTRYGCCLDGKESAGGPDNHGCPESK